MVVSLMVVKRISKIINHRSLSFAQFIFSDDLALPYFSSRSTFHTPTAIFSLLLQAILDTIFILR